MDPSIDTSLLTRYTHSIRTLAVGLSATFEERFQAWKDTWFKGELAISQSSQDRAKGDEWNALLALGPKIIALVVEKLTLRDNIFVIQLYNKFHSVQSLLVSNNDDDVAVYYTLNLHAKKIVALYSSYLADFEDKANAWRSYTSSSSGNFVNHPTYNALTSLDKEIILPLAIAKYSEDQEGPWYLLLSGLVDGKKDVSGVDNEVEYRKWVDWFVSTV